MIITLDLEMKEHQIFQNEVIISDQSNLIEQLKLQFENESLSSKSLLEKNKDLINKWEKAKYACEDKNIEANLLQVHQKCSL